MTYNGCQFKKNEKRILPSIYRKEVICFIVDIEDILNKFVLIQGNKKTNDFHLFKKWMHTGIG